jgi:hypothetical protein
VLPCSAVLQQFLTVLFMLSQLRASVCAGMWVGSLGAPCAAGPCFMGLWCVLW